MSEREAILTRIRQALGTQGGRQEPVPDRPPPARQDADREMFADRLVDYGVRFSSVSREGLQGELERLIAERMTHAGGPLLVPADLQPQLASHGARLPGQWEYVSDPRPHGSPLDNPTLDASAGVITMAGLAVAETGTIILDSGPGQGRRALSLVPDWHLCIVPVETLLQTFPEAVASLQQRHGEKWPPLTLISGPSATSDIELHRIEGVHGPRTLTVILVS